MALFGVRKGKEESNPTCIRMKSSLWAMSTLSTGRQERLRAAQGTPMLEGSEEGVVSVFSLSDLGHTPFHLLAVPLCLSDCLGWGGSERQLESRQASSLESSCLVTKPPSCHPSRRDRESRRQNQQEDAASVAGSLSFSIYDM